MQKKQKTLNQDGMITPTILVVLVVFSVFATGIMSWALQTRKSVVNTARGTQALQVAEAGIDYYKWHLAHDESDYQNGNSWCCDKDNPVTLSVADCDGVCGPYTEIYKDYDGKDIGEYSLLIEVPPAGSTIVQIESTGKTYKDVSVKKTIAAKLGKKSLARYSMLSNAPIWIGPDETTSGPLHSNKGIRFDGLCNAEVTSAVASYNCNTANHSCSGTKPGIWGSASNSCKQYWDFPDNYTDFENFTLNMADIQADAEAAGISLAPSGKLGYWLQFKSNGTVDVSRVTGWKYNVKYYDDNGSEVIGNEGVGSSVFIKNYPIPSNGLIFVKDNVFVEGTVNGRVTVAATKYEDTPFDYAKIYIESNITYLAKDGGDVLGLMSEGDIVVPRHAPVPVEIDAVMLSQKGHVYTRNYKEENKNKKIGSITVYGGIISNLFWTWTYTSGGKPVDGYTHTIMEYDNNLTFGPPPSFPTEKEYEVLDWSEK
ncbi:MAG: hypothetical protein WCQ96_01605 [Patescibacteria group bacterium]